MNWIRFFICFLLCFPSQATSLEMCPVIEPLRYRRQIDSGMVTAYEIPGVSQPERDSRGRLFVPGVGYGPWRYRAQCLPLCVVRSTVPGPDGSPPIPIEHTFLSSQCPPPFAQPQVEAPSITTSSPEPPPPPSLKKVNVTLSNRTESTQMYATFCF